MSPESLDALFNKNPLELTDAEIEKIVAKLEADRTKFMQAPEEEPRKSGPRKANTAKKIEAPVDISADDLLGKIGL